MRKTENIIGNVYGRLTVISYSHTIKTQQFNCLCVCGNLKVVSKYHLISGHTQSCGCIAKEKIINRNTTHGFGNSKKRDRLYSIYRNMITRCNNKNNEKYKYYGERGIKVCEEWELDFLNFRNWALNNGYRDDITIDRIDNDGNYEPSNCRWTDKITQSRNKRTNHVVTLNGVTACIIEHCELNDIKYTTYKKRIKAGYDIETALNKNFKSEKHQRSYERE